MISFDTGLSALRAAQSAMQIVGQNVANADTEGYSRQRVLLDSVAPATGGSGRLVGHGVKVAAVRREADDLLAGRLRAEVGVEGRLDALAGRLGEIEALFSEPGDASLGTAINEFFDRMSELAADAGDPTLRSQAIQAAENLARRFSTLANRLEAVRRDVRPEMDARIGEVNEAAKGIAGLNRQIVASLQRGDGANELLDRRERLIQSLARQLDVSVVRDPGGSATILAGGNLIVSGSRAHALEVVPSDGTTVKLRVVGSESTFSPSGGFLKGLAEIEGKIVPDLLAGLDQLSRQFMYEVNRSHARGVGSDGSFESLVSSNAADPDRPLADAGLPFDPTAGPLYLSVTRTATGEVEQHRLDVDPTKLGIRDFASMIGDLEGIRASVDTVGRLHVRALPGFKFDFADRVDPNPGNLGGSLVGLAGRFEGPGNSPVTLHAVGTGRVGVTEGLEVEVRGPDGSVIRTLDVGLGYSPGDPLELSPGLTVHLGSGDLLSGDELALDLVSEPDPGGLLPALGLNSLFAGRGAADMRVAASVAEDASKLATGRGGSGNNLVALDLLKLRDTRFAELDNDTPGEFYGLLVGEVGQQRRTNMMLQENERGLLRSLEARREEISGVNVDEEMVDLLRYQRGFQAAARFISAVSQMTELLVSLR